MDSRTLELLEFPKVLNALSEMAVSASGAASCLDIRPFSSFDEISREAALYSEAMAWIGESRFRLGSFPDLAGLFSFLRRSGSVLDLDALAALRQTLVQAHNVRESLRKYEEREWNTFTEFIHATPWPAKIWAAIGRCIDAEGRLKDESSPDLFAVRSEIRSIHQSCTKRVKDFILGENLSQFMQEEFMTISSDRYVLPLKTNFKGRIKGIIHDYSQSGETCYFEPLFLVETNNRLQELKKEEREEEFKVFQYLTDLVLQEYDGVYGAFTYLVKLDVLQAKSLFAEKIGGSSVEIQQNATPNLRNAKHPLLVYGGTDVQAIDVEFEADKKILVISGGNAGGKTVSIKTLGLTAVMALAALPVCCDEGSVLPLWDKVFVIMGDEQSLEEHVSTFTAQIRCLSQTWDAVDENTLYLLDEFGAGTDPTQGAALAQGVIDDLIRKGATAMAATHFPALKAYALATEGVRAASVLFDPSTNKPLFKLAYDQVGASIALDVAREHGLPNSILERAEKYLLLDGSDTSAVLDRLNALAVKREGQLDELEEEKRKTRIKRKKLEQKFDKERTKVLNDVRADAQNVLKEWREDKLSRKQALKKLSETRSKISVDDKQKQPKTAPFSFEELQINGKVRYTAWDKVGVVVELNAKKKTVKVNLDGVALWVKFSDLSKVGATKKPASQGGPDTSKANDVPGLSLRLDIRGQRADMAMSTLEKFLDSAILRGASTLEIVHGRGTGALRREVHNFLRDFPQVADYRFAPEDRGGDGMTEVDLQ
ncbi:MAG: endonuclease MutS2 [Desulfovibrio sp.]